MDKNINQDIGMSDEEIVWYCRILGSSPLNLALMSDEEIQSRMVSVRNLVNKTLNQTEAKEIQENSENQRFSTEKFVNREA